MDSLSPRNYSAAHIRRIKESCSLFFQYAEIHGAHSMNEINFPLLDSYHQFMSEAEGRYRDYEFALIPLFIYLAERGIGHIGYAYYFRYAKFGKCTSMSDISAAGFSSIEEHRRERLSFPVSEFYGSIPDFMDKIRNAGYSNTILRSTEYHLSVLGVFLDREQLGYNRAIADIWISELA